MGQSSKRVEEGTKKGKEGEKERERQSAETSRTVSRSALLYNFIALSPVFCGTAEKRVRG